MSAPPAKKPGLSLYANLLQSDKQKQGATISSAPVKYDVKEEDAQRKKDGIVSPPVFVPFAKQ